MVHYPAGEEMTAVIKGHGVQWQLFNLRCSYYPQLVLKCFIYKNYIFFLLIHLRLCSDVGGSTVALKQEGPGFKSWPGAFVHGF